MLASLTYISITLDPVLAPGVQNDDCPAQGREPLVTTRITMMLSQTTKKLLRGEQTKGNCCEKDRCREP
jgi:hypothetical protein